MVLEKLYLNLRLLLNFQIILKLFSKIKNSITSDKFFRTTRVVEESDVDGITKKVICIPDDLGKKEDNLLKEIGYKFEPETLSCDDGTHRIYSVSLLKGKNNTANVSISNISEIVNNGVSIVVFDKSLININKDGFINSISSEAVAKIKKEKIFTISYTSTNITQ